MGEEMSRFLLYLLAGFIGFGLAMLVASVLFS